MPLDDRRGQALRPGRRSSAGTSGRASPVIVGRRRRRDRRAALAPAPEPDWLRTIARRRRRRSRGRRPAAATSCECLLAIALAGGVAAGRAGLRGHAATPFGVGVRSAAFGLVVVGERTPDGQQGEDQQEGGEREHREADEPELAEPDDGARRPDAAGAGVERRGPTRARGGTSEMTRADRRRAPGRRSRRRRRAGRRRCRGSPRAGYIAIRWYQHSRHGSKWAISEK